MLHSFYMKYILGIIIIGVLGVLAYLFIWVPQQTIEMNDELPPTITSMMESKEETPAAQPEDMPFISERVALTDTPLHPADGYVRVFEDEGTQYLRYEELHTINGPDLFVYLATDDDASDFINLGRLKATNGNINYAIPEGTDLDTYSHALVWCRAFGVLFNSADLSTVLNGKE